MDRAKITLRSFVPPEPPRTPKSVRTRRLLLDHAAALFIERGYTAVSIQDIAEAAGLTTGALYGHFRSKGQLLVEVFRTRIADADRRSELEDIAPDPGVEMMYSEDRRELRLLEVDAAAAARHDDDVAAGLREIYRDRLAQIEAAIPDAADPEVAAWVICVLNGGIGLIEAVGPPLPPADRLKAALIASTAGLLA
jgi:AcrR family transcriptional regulator